MIKVCDALCGSGKTTACISMMNNSNKDYHYIFVTQYLSEVKRIITSCDQRQFVTPISITHKKGKTTKLEDVHSLLQAKKDIATTHALFTSFTDETKRLLREGKYIFVLDEVIDVCCETNIVHADLEIMNDAKLLEKEKDSDFYEWRFDNYSESDGLFTDISRKARSKNLMEFQDVCLFWTIPPELFTVFEDVYILTYLFEYQPLCYFLRMHNIEYKLIGVRNNKFVDEISPGDRVRDLQSKVHILDLDAVNKVGNGRTALSYTWYKKESDPSMPNNKVKILSRNLYNVARNIFKSKADNFMWTTYKERKDLLGNKGYLKSFVTYNKRASNEYANKNHLAYLVNVFFRPWEVAYYRSKGIADVNQDMYALSSLVQWVFRSAIRNNKDIWIYIPSARMRFLLEEWLRNLSRGEDLTPIHYDSLSKLSSKKLKTSKQELDLSKSESKSQSSSNRKNFSLYQINKEKKKGGYQ